MSFCKIKGCRFNSSHSTRGHRCPCGEFGHGRRECKNQIMVDFLRNNHFDEEIEPNRQCTLDTCGENKKYHTIDAHYCTICDNRHAEMNCPNLCQMYAVKCPLCRRNNYFKKNFTQLYGSEEICKVCLESKVSVFLPQCGHACLCTNCMMAINTNNSNTNQNNETFEDEIHTVIHNTEQYEVPEEHDEREYAIDQAKPIIGNINSPVYVVVPGGQGCSWYVKRLNVNSPFRVFFMHGDAWGQYGPETDDRPKLYEFLENHTEITE